MSAAVFPISVHTGLECSQIHYDVGVNWLCVEEGVPPTNWTFHGQAWIPDYPLPGAGGYPKWHVKLEGIDEGAAYHTASFSCYHDTWLGPDDTFIYTHQFDPLADPAYTWTHCLNVNSVFELVATVDVDEGLSAYGQSGEWAAAGCPNILYADYQFDDGFAQAQVNVGWFSGKQSVPRVREFLRVEPVVSRVRQSVSRVSKVLSRASSYFRQRNFKR